MKKCLDCLKKCLECDRAFQPFQPSEKICSDQCRKDRARRKGQEFRDANREKIRKYARDNYAKNIEARRAKANERNAANRSEVNRKYRERYPEKERIRRQVKQYGVTWEEAERLLAQKTCEICQEERPLATDHDHKTGKVRGRLCHQCNRGLGLFNDDIDKLKEAIRYLGQTHAPR